MALTQPQKRHLRQLAHARKPVVIVGNAGVSESLLKELDISLEHHELIKVRVNAEDREARQQMVEQLRSGSGSELVQMIGHIAILFRPAQKPHIKLP